VNRKICKRRPKPDFSDIQTPTLLTFSVSETYGVRDSQGGLGVVGLSICGFQIKNSWYQTILISAKYRKKTLILDLIYQKKLTGSVQINTFANKER
jgi:hypothetical protein